MTDHEHPIPYDWETEELVDDLKECFMWSNFVHSGLFPRGAEK